MGRAFDTLRITGLETGSFFGVLLFGLFAGVGGFFWTLHSTEPGRFQTSAGIGQYDNDAIFGRAARRLYAEGAFEELIELTDERREIWPNDPDGLLFAGFAHERLAEAPGLVAFEHAAKARERWADLELLTHSHTIRNEAYFQGWARRGLGSVLPASERFGWFASDDAGTLFRNGSYNQACYLALAGRVDEARKAYTTAMIDGTIDARWAAHDPDLEILHGTHTFEILTEYANMSRAEPLMDSPSHAGPGSRYTSGPERRGRRGDDRSLLGESGPDGPHLAGIASHEVGAAAAGLASGGTASGETVSGGPASGAGGNPKAELPADGPPDGPDGTPASVPADPIGDHPSASSP